VVDVADFSGERPLNPLPMAILGAPILPEGYSVFFSNWYGPDELPSPEEVMAHHDIIDSGRRSIVVRFVHLNLVVKYGRSVKITEGQALWLINNYTDVRAPTLYGWFQAGDVMFLYMSLADGVSLQRRWPELSEEEKLDVCDQLRQMLDSMRSLRSPPIETNIGMYYSSYNFFLCPFDVRRSSNCLGALGRTQCNDSVFWGYPGLSGPFDSLKAFHDSFTTINLLPGAGEFAAYSRRGLPDNIPIVFTHGDLHFSNIIISPVGSKVVGIIDWEFAGFYPEYWEWAKLKWAGLLESHYVDKVVEPHMSVWEYWFGWMHYTGHL
jgi:hypothetical protein